jgi:predicted nucleic acid binding AN1-type Zn finger protein
MEELILEPVIKEQKDRKRCFDCNKKVGLLGTECKCSYVFCNSHRLPENHKCSFDYKIGGKKKL